VGTGKKDYPATPTGRRDTIPTRGGHARPMGQCERTVPGERVADVRARAAEPVLRPAGAAGLDLADEFSRS